MVDPDAVLSANGTKTTIMHFFQTDLNITSQASNYSRLAAPTIVPAFESYLKPSPPAGQIHRYTLLLFVQPVTLTKDIVTSAFSTVFAQSGLGVDRAGFDIAKFQRLTNITELIGATYFQFGNGSVPTGGGLNLNGTTSLTMSRGSGGRIEVSKWAVLGFGFGVVGALGL
jgi:hypothetical protein